MYTIAVCYTCKVDKLSRGPCSIVEGLLPNKLYAYSGSKLFDTLMVLPKELFKKLQMAKTSMQNYSGYKHKTLVESTLYYQGTVTLNAKASAINMLYRSAETKS